MPSLNVHMPSDLRVSALQRCALGDSDNDGLPEIVIGVDTGYKLPFPIERFEYNPALRTYEHRRTFPAVSAQGGQPLVADLDGDGQNELVYSTALDLAGTFIVYESSGDDSYTFSFRERETLQSLSHDVVAVRLPGSSIPALVVPSNDSGDLVGGRLLVFAPTGLAGDYANLTAVQVTIPNNVVGVAAGDLDGDGRLDVVLAPDEVGSVRKVYVYEAE